MFVIENIVAYLMLFIIHELIFNMAHDKVRGMGRVLTTNRYLERSTPSFGLPMPTADTKLGAKNENINCMAFLSFENLTTIYKLCKHTALIFLATFFPPCQTPCWCVISLNLSACSIINMK